MEVENVVRIVKIGPIQDVDVQNMIDTVQLFSNVYSQMMKEAKLYILIQKKLRLEI